MQICSDIVLIDKPEIVSTEIIENVLINRFGSIIRWAVIEVLDNELKLCVTYEKRGIINTSFFFI